VSGREGDNIARHSGMMPWYGGPTVLEALDQFQSPLPETDRPFRMAVQDVYKFTRQGDDRRIVAGTIDSGSARVGDEVVFYPSGKKAKIATFEAFNRTTQTKASAGEAAGFTLAEQIYVTRGEMAAVASESRPQVTTRIRASVFWLGRRPLVRSRDYILKLGSARVPMRVEAIHRVLDASSLAVDEHKTHVDRHEVAECTLKTSRAIACDLASELAITSRFVIVDEFEISGGGIVRATPADTLSGMRDRVLLRNYKWEASHIGIDSRAERYRQRPTLVLVTSDRAEDRKALGKNVEQALFDLGNVVYFLGMGNVVYGIDADIERSAANRHEHLRRLAEVANLMLDAGIILVVTAADLSQADVEVIKTTVDPERIQVVWVGDVKTTDVSHDLLVPDAAAPDAVDQVKQLLQEKGIIFRPW
jgi:bifunctional enzyme CysN/CysC